MKFKGQGKINICGFEYKTNIADSRGGGGGGGSEHPKNPCIRAWPVLVTVCHLEVSDSPARVVGYFNITG